MISGFYRPDGGSITFEGTDTTRYRPAEIAARLVSTESWGEGWPETLNTLVLTEHDGKTTITQTMLYPSKESRDAALAAYCAGDQDKFWEMHAHMFANALGEDVGSFSDKRLKAIAETVGLDMAAFNSCYDSGKYLDRVQQDFEDGQAANINGTPGFLVTYTVNGETKTKLIEGAQPFSNFQVELEAALNEIGATVQ